MGCGLKNKEVEEVRANSKRQRANIASSRDLNFIEKEKVQEGEKYEGEEESGSKHGETNGRQFNNIAFLIQRRSMEQRNKGKQREGGR